MPRHSAPRTPDQMPPFRMQELRFAVSYFQPFFFTSISVQYFDRKHFGLLIAWPAPRTARPTNSFCAMVTGDSGKNCDGQHSLVDTNAGSTQAPALHKRVGKSARCNSPHKDSAPRTAVRHKHAVHKHKDADEHRPE